MIRTEVVTTIPQKSGIYFFKKSKTILYIGKAANLRARLKSYISHDLDPAKRAMVARATSLAWEETSNEIEALLKEAQLIKRHKPPYNVLMRDDKNYSFAGFTKEKFPKVFVTHQPLHRASSGQRLVPAGRHGYTLYARFIGPFTDGAALKKTLHLLRRIFPYCACKRPHARPCQYAQMGLCLGYCCSMSFLPPTHLAKSRQVNAQNDVKQKLAIAKKRYFSIYRMYRKNIAAIRAILSGRRVDFMKKIKKEMRMRSRAHDFEAAAVARDKLAALERVFAHRPFLQNDQQAEHEKGLRILQIIAKLPSLPHRVEAYDISHHHGKESVGSMVVFENGRPEKSQYRKFKIRHVPGINDPAMIQEVLTRRLRHAEWPMPNFILIDGGKPQLNAAFKATNSQFSHGKNEAPRSSVARYQAKFFRSRIPSFARLRRASEGLFSSPSSPQQAAGYSAKENKSIEANTTKMNAITIGAIAKHKEELYLQNKKPIALKTMPPSLLHLLQHLRNEAHRFAISFSKHRFHTNQFRA